MKADLTPITIHTEYITLGALIKFCSIASSGGQAKDMISGGHAKVNGTPIYQRGKKLYRGDVIAIDMDSNIVTFIVE